MASLVGSMRSFPLILTPNAVFMASDMRRGHIVRRTAKRGGLHLYSRLTGAVVCSSRIEADEAIASKVPRSKVTWIYLPVVDDRVRPETPAARAPDTNLRVGFLGRLHPSKNLKVLIDAIGQLETGVTLSAAGRGDPAIEKKLMLQADRVLPGRSDFIGWVDGAEKREFFSSIDLLAMPSEYECFGVAAVEALAAGVPVITSNRVGIADIVQTHGAGMIVPPTQAGFADGLRAYVSDRSMLRAHAATARAAAVAETSFSAHGERLADLYHRVVRTQSL
jgi:glycosyltransferase involved in cell wall biosynthesis